MKLLGKIRRFVTSGSVKKPEPYGDGSDVEPIIVNHTVCAADTTSDLPHHYTMKISAKTEGSAPSIMIGGCGGEKSPKQYMVGRAIAQKGKTDANALFLLGDLIYHHGYTSIDDLNKAIPAPYKKLEAPIFLGLGNHGYDIQKVGSRGGMEAAKLLQEIYSFPKSTGSKKDFSIKFKENNTIYQVNDILKQKDGSLAPKISMPNNYYLVKINPEKSKKPTYVFMLDSCLLPYDRLQQEWLKKSLEAIKEDCNIIVMTHHTGATFGKRYYAKKTDAQYYAEYADSDKDLPKPGGRSAMKILDNAIASIIRSDDKKSKDKHTKPKGLSHNRIVKHSLNNILKSIENKTSVNNISAIFAAHDHHMLIKDIKHPTNPDKKMFSITTGGLGGHMQNIKHLDDKRKKHHGVEKILYHNDISHGFTDLGFTDDGALLICMHKVCRINNVNLHWIDFEAKIDTSNDNKITYIQAPLDTKRSHYFDERKIKILKLFIKSYSEHYKVNISAIQKFITSPEAKKLESTMYIKELMKIIYNQEVKNKPVLINTIWKALLHCHAIPKAFVDDYITYCNKTFSEDAVNSISKEHSTAEFSGEPVTVSDDDSISKKETVDGGKEPAEKPKSLTKLEQEQEQESEAYRPMKPGSS